MNYKAYRHPNGMYFTANAQHHIAQLLKHHRLSVPTNPADVRYPKHLDSEFERLLNNLIDAGQIYMTGEQGQ